MGKCNWCFVDFEKAYMTEYRGKWCVLELLEKERDIEMRQKKLVRLVKMIMI